MFAADLGVEGDPPRGIEGLLALSSAFDQHLTAAHVDEDDERVFVELAGSYLAVLLLDELNEARHCAQSGRHRLACGPHGYFDPFAAVERVLDADDVRRALAREVALAEAETRGEGPIARVVREIVRQLEAHVGEVEVREQFETHLELVVAGEAVELDVGGVVRATFGESDPVVRGAVRRMLAALPAFAESGASALEDLEDRILPRLLGARFLASVADRGIYATPLVGEVQLGFILRYEGRARFLRRAEVETWGASPERLRELAVRNLAGRSIDARFMHVEGEEGALVVARSGDGLDSARILLPGLHDVLAPELGSPFAVAVPHRDALFACKMQDVALMRERAALESARAPHAISSEIFVIGPDGTPLAWRG
ncbi:MAG: DUF1444 family protein [Myxococcales bacterium]